MHEAMHKNIVVMHVYLVVGLFRDAQINASYVFAMHK
jgi:hypothetical protein